eukprot:m.113420 g.113420  ORF g.113420 m.113420 type:complete len:150 (-) comp15443_c1_seq1:1841-2290(-)
MDATSTITPVELQGEVIKGFGRGSKELGIPTANFPEDVVDSLPDSMKQGIYYGWAQVNDDQVRMAVMSVGWNPYYKNTKRSAEVHILHQFADDFYGQTMRMLVLGHIRPERNFDSLEPLIEAINEDIRMTKELLADSQEYKNSFFKQAA